MPASAALGTSDTVLEPSEGREAEWVRGVEQKEQQATATLIKKAQTSHEANKSMQIMTYVQHSVGTIDSASW